MGRVHTSASVCVSALTNTFTHSCARVYVVSMPAPWSWEPAYLLGCSELTGPGQHVKAASGRLRQPDAEAPGYRGYHYPGCVAGQNGSPQAEFHQGGPPSAVRGRIPVNRRPAARSGIKRQVERESIPWLEWGGNKKVQDTCRVACRHTHTVRDCLFSFPFPAYFAVPQENRAVPLCLYSWTFLHKVLDYHLPQYRFCFSLGARRNTSLKISI